MAAAPRRPAPQPSSTHAAQIKPNAYTPPGPMGNTVGMIVPDTETSPGANSAPAIVPTKKEESWWKRWGSDVTHGVLDVVGLIPVVGEIADGASALIYVAEGDYVNAAISAAAMIPGAGMAATGAKYGKKVIGAVVESAAKKAEREAAERAAKELAKKKAEKEAAEAAANANKGKKGGKDKGNPRCILRPYKPDTCKPRTGHHVVPDRVFRTGSRGSAHPWGITEESGLVICVDGSNLSKSKEHGQIHAIYDPLERAAGLIGSPIGSAKLVALEAAGAFAAGKITGCNPLLLEAQLRAYHQANGLGMDAVVRADPSGKILIDPSKMGATPPTLPSR